MSTISTFHYLCQVASENKMSTPLTPDLIGQYNEGTTLERLLYSVLCLGWSSRGGIWCS